MRRILNLTALMVSATLLTAACTQSQLDRLEYVGKHPPLEKFSNPTEQAGYAPITWPAAPPKAMPLRTANSLWTPGSTSFFKDQRANRVGDILTVNVQISDRAEFENSTELERQNTDDLDLPGLFGLEGKVFQALPGEVGGTNDIISINSTRDVEGEGTIEREETIETQIAAVITQVLPNDNLVVTGTQEIRVNFEVRQLTVQGIVRPEDIGATNTINLNQLAEARISYGGRGLITDLQQPRVGSQIVDILSPF